MNWKKTTALAAALALGGWSSARATRANGNDEQEHIRVALTGENSLELQAFWEPVTDWAMSAGEVASNETLLGVTPAEPTRVYRTEDFEPWLPAEAVQVGDVWEVDRDAVLRFLTQFHPEPRSSLHHEPVAIPGSWACLRAVGERHAEILTRSHAQFVLEGDIHYTPAQFEGRLVVDLEHGTVVAYDLVLPDRYTNVDVNVPTEQTRRMPTNFGMPGIGWIPRMELRGPTAPSDLAWSASIGYDEARKHLREKYYGAVDWMPFEEAVAVARDTDKLLHVVVILGTLDDESC